MDNELKQTEKVQRIIALKRYEQPPPGYFHLLPNRIINCIEKGEGKSSPWITWFSAFTLRPAWACAFGLGVCSAVTLGMFYPRQSDAGAAASSLGVDGSIYAVATPSLDDASAETGTSSGLHLASRLGGSTDPVTTPEAAASVFDSPTLSQEALTVPVSLFIGN